VQQDRIVVEKFADYWNKGNVHIDRIVYQPIVDGTVRLANLKSGALDLIERLLATDIKEVRADSRLKLNATPDLSYWGITLNVANGDKSKNPLGQHAKVRQAFNLAIDRDAINQVVFNGEFVPGNQWVGPDSFYYQKSLPVPKRDVAKAKALIKEAGVATPIAIDFMVPQGAENKAISEVVQAMAAEAGFDLKIRVTEFATSLKSAEAGDFQAFLIGWSGRTDPDGNLYTFHACKAPNNNGGYCNPDVDKLLNEARTYSDPAKRKPVYEKVAKTLLDEGQIVYLYHRKVLIAQTTRLEGFVPVPDGLVRVVGLRLK
jgi:peptide/nickel transport system substrate-binding protein